MNEEHWKLYGAQSQARRREAGVTRMNLVLSPEELHHVGKIMKQLGCSRMDAIRTAILRFQP